MSKRTPKPQGVKEAETGPRQDGSPPGVILRTLRGHDNFVHRIAWSPDGRRLASPSKDRTVRIWDAETAELLRSLAASPTGWVLSVAWSPDGRSLASVGFDKTVRVWDAETGEQLQAFTGHEGYASSVAWSPLMMVASGRAWRSSSALEASAIATVATLNCLACWASSWALWPAARPTMSMDASPWLFRCSTTLSVLTPILPVEPRMISRLGCGLFRGAGWASARDIEPVWVDVIESAVALTVVRFAKEE